MKHFLKLTDWKWVEGSQTEMMYQDNNVEWFVGKPRSVVIGQTYVVEISEGKAMSDGYRHIVKFEGTIQTKGSP